MSRKFTIDIDKMLDVGRQLGENAPMISQALASAGFAPEAASKWIGLASVAATLASKMFPPSSGFPLPAGLDLGPVGRGRYSYLRSRKRYSDETVLAGAGEIFAADPPFPALSQAEQAMAYTLSLLFPDHTGDWSAAQRRTALDQILETDGALPQETTDRLGDLLWHAINRSK